MSHSILRGFDALVDRGSNLRMPLSKALGGGLFELRIIDRDHIRFIYTFCEGHAFILHGFYKKTEKIQKPDLEYAKKQLKLLK